MKLRPPTHRADAGGIFVAAHDPAWDQELFNADAEALLSKALAPVQDAAEAAHRAKHADATAEDIAALRGACALTAEQQTAALRGHPGRRYFLGLTRYQIDAPEHAPDGSPCTVRERYLTRGKACEFTIRRLRSEVYQAADEIVSTGARLTQFARMGLRAINSPDWTWTIEDGATRAPQDVIEALHEADPSLPLAIGRAVILMCRPIDDAELFR
jgi:hypothetical protein